MIRVEQLYLSVGTFQLTDLSFELPTGSYTVLMGKTGCGKTTLLEAICGLRHIDSGQIIIDQRNVTSLPPAQRNIGFVPQDAALFDHLDVYDQISFALKLRKWDSSAIEKRVHELAGWLGLERILHRSVIGLSGGEMQRIALGRAIAFEPKILCLDEPLSALDQETRDSMCDVLEALQQRTGMTILHITHSRAEADRLADIVLSLRERNIEREVMYQ